MITFTDTVVDMSEAILVDVQFAGDVEEAAKQSLPSKDSIFAWLGLAYAMTFESTANLQDKPTNLTPEISIRIVSIGESQSLNSQYRGKDKPTNVLSFESDLPDFVQSGFLGDLVICAQVVCDEARS